MEKNADFFKKMLKMLGPLKSLYRFKNYKIYFKYF
jgi:hypothetical protein